MTLLSKAARRMRRLPHWLALTSLALVVGGTAAVPAHSSATAPAPTADALAQARTIQTEINARYRLPGRRLVVTEATGMGGEMLALWNIDWLDGRIVPTDSGIYFSICSARARCPTPCHGLRGRLPLSCLAGRHSSSLFAPSWRHP